MKVRRRNLLKLETLAIFEDRGALSPPAWAVLAGFYPIRAAYSYLRRLNRWGLLNRSRRRGVLVYRLNTRGAERLAWLREQKWTEDQ